MQYRYELKYVCSDCELMFLQNVACSIMFKDKNLNDNTCYNIRSVYFDTYHDKNYYENENGNDPREKFRIRMYNRDPNFIRLELKHKRNNMTLKESSIIDTIKCTNILKNNYHFEDIESNLEERFYISQKNELLVPKVLIQYDRIPYTYPIGNVRVTFDMNIMASRDVQSFYSGDVTMQPVMPKGYHVLEVKYDNFLPDFIVQCLQLDSLQQSTFSKYYISSKCLL